MAIRCCQYTKLRVPFGHEGNMWGLGDSEICEICHTSFAHIQTFVVLMCRVGGVLLLRTFH